MEITEGNHTSNWETKEHQINALLKDLGKGYEMDSKREGEIFIIRKI